jgi:predicted ribosome quality control (RQC) complex YloA/Tae2 family protein
MKHLLRGQITAIEQVGWDRIMKITVAPEADVIETPSKSIITEFMGKHSNIILIEDDSGRILESIKRIDETVNRYREVLPGVVYKLPPRPEKQEPLQMDFAAFASLVKNPKEMSWKLLFDQIDGLSPTLAKEILVRAGDNPTLNQLWEAYRAVVKHFQPGESRPQVFVEGEGNRIVAASALKLEQYSHTTSRPYNAMSEALEAYYDAILLEEKIQAERNALNQILSRTQAAIEQKLALLRQDLANAEQAEDYRTKGELLTANLHRLKPRQTVIEVQNYYSPDLAPMRIELDPNLSPSENVQRYFKQYNKAKRGRAILHQLIADNEAELEVLDYYRLEVEEAGSLEELQANRAELVKKGWIREQKKPTKQAQSSSGVFRKYTSPDGFQIYVGRNSTENDLLIRRVASKNDMWLHAKQIHGSHVIIRNPENKPGIPMTTLLQAAQIAAAYSKARHSSYVPVDYTWAKHVVKPRKSASGFVTYTHEKTLYVEPMPPKEEN